MTLYTLGNGNVMLPTPPYIDVLECVVLNNAVHVAYHGVLFMITCAWTL